MGYFGSNCIENVEGGQCKNISTMTFLSSTDSYNNESKEIISDIIENPVARYFIVTIHIVGMVLAIIGNSMLIYHLLKSKSLRGKVAVYLVLNLAICDLLAVLLHEPMRVFDIVVPFALKGSIFSHTIKFCRVNGFFSSYFSSVAFHTIAAISQERFMIICHPFKAKSILTVSRTIKILALIWGVSFVCVLPFPILFTFVANERLGNVNVSFCLMDMFSGDIPGGRIYFMFLFCFYFAAPTIVITLSYTKIFYELNRNFGGMAKCSENMKRVMKSRKNLSLAMLAIAVLFVLCNGPLWFTFLFICFGYKIEKNPIFALMMIEFLPLICHVCDPFIYTIRTRTFRKGMSAMFSQHDGDEEVKSLSTNSFRATSGSPLTRSKSKEHHGDRKSTNYLNRHSYKAPSVSPRVQTKAKDHHKYISCPNGEKNIKEEFV